MEAAVEARLRAHVESIVEQSRLPSADREDVAEELLGHLVSRTEELAAGGLDEETAASKAIEEFGGAPELAPGFRDAFHSRFWASTIGVLLPTERGGPGRPTSITALACLAVLAAVLTVGGAVVVALNATPARALLLTPLFGLGAAVDWLAAVAIVRGQRWGFFVGLLIAVAMLLQGLAQMTSGPGTNISLSGIAAAVTLVAIGVNGAGVDAWFARSRPLPGPLAAAVGLVAALSIAAGLAPSAVPDPTQIGPEDITATAAVSCWTEAVPPPDPGAEDDSDHDPNERVLKVATNARIRWLRTDLFPKGFTVGPEGYGDALAFQPNISLGQLGAPEIEPWPADIGVEYGSWGPAVPDEVSEVEGAGGSVRGIDGQLIRPGNEITARSEFMGIIVGELGENIEPPLVDVTYWHLDRFVLRASVSCGHEAQLAPLASHR